jgi:hypothetical protein
MVQKKSPQKIKEIPICKRLDAITEETFYYPSRRRNGSDVILLMVTYDDR